ncbi:MAG TPA: deoxyribodipyrimidine photo-lyase [Arenimonas sp.]|uniref:cryptochrome/photolyase family protein n=1 Tax=Arenimonas sp. TaxID=1872635 RepID=UPI002B7499DB|nr:deoxyribodipyrimidine photo-lyase [Arenimonas sp.]HMB56690.1 deoxyribodipyrimidine photo-lyase [Arenimonas sp.]
MASALVWFRRDLRLADNPALQAAIDAGYAIIPVYIHAPDEDAPWSPGAASRAWLHKSLLSLAADLRVLGSRLIVRSGDSLEQLDRLVAETRAEAVFWSRLYEPAAIARDSRIKEHLRTRGLAVESHNAALLVEPWTIATQAGDPYRVFTPFWKNALHRLDAGIATSAPSRLPQVADDLVSQPIEALALAPGKNWDAAFWRHWQPGEAGAAELLEIFIDGAAHGYKEQRNFPDRTGSSKLSPHLHFGEISPRQILRRLRADIWPAKWQADIDHFVSELGWREFAHHLLFHFPKTSEENLSRKFAGFRWAEPEPDKLAAWQRGHTGIPIVDAGMRELWATGWMHNRVRMIVASVLCKNLRYHWRQGASWFWDTLVDADLANNTQGWQWTAGTGADAAPYFRIFNPVTQSQRFDPYGNYIRRWLPELAVLPTPALFAPWEHAALARSLAPAYPAQPIIDLRRSREAALAALADCR